MTEVEFSTLLSDLAKTAKILNEKSDSVNALVKRFEDALERINVGIEVWPTVMGSEVWEEEDQRDGEWRRVGTCDTELGYTKIGDEWRLALREAYSRDDGQGGSDFEKAEEERPLLDASRNVRIKALAAFPRIANALKDAAEAAIRTIDKATAYVK